MCVPSLWKDDFWSSDLGRNQRIFMSTFLYQKLWLDLIIKWRKLVNSEENFFFKVWSTKVEPKLGYTQNSFNRVVLQYWTEEDLVWQILSFELIICKYSQTLGKARPIWSNSEKILTLDIHEGLILLPDESPMRLPNPSFPLWVNEVVY